MVAFTPSPAQASLLLIQSTQNDFSNGALFQAIENIDSLGLPDVLNEPAPLSFQILYDCTASITGGTAFTSYSLSLIVDD
jgi:hypothetical protein